MAEYELVREIQNSCSGNQMRDVFFDEIETDDPERYVRDLLKAESIDELTREERSTIHGNNERIRLETACRAVEFFIRVMKQC